MITSTKSRGSLAVSASESSTSLVVSASEFTSVLDNFANRRGRSIYNSLPTRSCKGNSSSSVQVFSDCDERSIYIRGSGKLEGHSLQAVNKSKNGDDPSLIGYCYVRLFQIYFEGALGVEELHEKIVRVLGVYPTLRNVIKLLIDLSIEKKHGIDGFLPPLVVISKLRLHVRRNVNKLMTFNEFINMYHPYFDSCVGSDDNLRGKKSNLASLQAVAAKFGFEYDAVIGHMVAKQSQIPTSFYVQEALAQDIKNGIEQHRRLPDQYIKNQLTREQQSIITSLFGERYGVVFTQTITHPHAMADAIRQLERLDLMNACNYSFSQTKSEVLGCQIVNVGGNYGNAFTREWTEMHSCCPLLNARDESRNVNRRATLQRQKKITISKEKMLQDIVDSKDPLGCNVFCHRKAEDCKIRSNCMIFCHSAYDMTTTQIADAMESHKVNVSYSVMVFDESMLTDTEGRIEVLGMNWRRYDNKGERFSDERISGRSVHGLLRDDGSFVSDVDKRYSGGTICFWFDGAGNEPYEHDFGVYISKFLVSIIISSRGTCYKAEQANKIAGSQRITWTRISSTLDISSSFKWNLSHQAHRVRVQYYVFDRSSPSKELRKKKVAYIDEKFYSRIHDYAIAQKDNKFTLHDLLTFAISQQYYVMINAKTIRENTVKDFGADQQDLLEVVCAVYCFAYTLRNDVGETLKKQVEKIKAYRDDTKTAFRTVVCSIFKSVRFSQSELWEKLLAWFSYHDDYAVKVSSMPTDIVYRTTVSNRCVRFDSITQVSNYSMVFPDRQNLDAEFMKDMFAPVGPSNNITAFETNYGTLSNVCLECKKDLRLVKIKGDGNCYFYSLMVGLYGHGLIEHNMSVAQFKQSLKIPHDLFCDDWNDILDTPDRWGETTMSTLVVAVYDVNVCVHMGEQYQLFEGGSLGTVHIQFGNNHFDLLWDFDKNFSTVSAFALVVPHNTPLGEGTPITVLRGGSDIKPDIVENESEKEQIYAENIAVEMGQPVDDAIDYDSSEEASEEEKKPEENASLSSHEKTATKASVDAVVENRERVSSQQNAMILFLQNEIVNAADRKKKRNNAKLNDFNAYSLCAMAKFVITMTFNSWSNFIRKHLDSKLCACCSAPKDVLLKACEKYYRKSNDVIPFKTAFKDWYDEKSRDYMPSNIYEWLFCDGRQPIGTYCFIYGESHIYVDYDTVQTLNAMQHMIETKQIARDILNRVRSKHESAFSRDEIVRGEVSKAKAILNKEPVEDIYRDGADMNTRSFSSRRSSVSSHASDVHGRAATLKRTSSTQQKQNTSSAGVAPKRIVSVPVNQQVFDFDMPIKQRISEEDLQHPQRDSSTPVSQHTFDPELVPKQRISTPDMNSTLNSTLGSTLSLANSVREGFNEVDELRAELASFDKTVYEQVRSIMRPKKREGVVNYSQLKMTELLQRYFIDYSAQNVLDLCSSPGGFVAALKDHFATLRTIYIHTYEGENAIKFNKNVIDNRCRMLKNKKNGDLTSSVEVSNIVGQLPESMIDLVTADGFINTSEEIPNEQDNAELVKNEVFIALASLKTGGCLIVKTFDFRTSDMREVLKTLYANFENVMSARTYYSGPVSGEVYFVCLRKREKKDFNSSKFKNFYRTISKTYNDDNIQHLRKAINLAYKLVAERKENKTVKKNSSAKHQKTNMPVNERSYHGDSVAVVLPVACGKTTFSKKYNLIDTEHLIPMDAKLLNMRTKAQRTGNYLKFNSEICDRIRKVMHKHKGIYLTHHQDLATSLNLPIVRIIIPSLKMLENVRGNLSAERYELMKQNSADIYKSGGDHICVDSYAEIDGILQRVIEEHQDASNVGFWNSLVEAISSDSKNPPDLITYVNTNNQHDGLVVCATDYSFRTADFVRLGTLPRDVENFMRVYRKKKHILIMLEGRNRDEFSENFRKFISVLSKIFSCIQYKDKIIINVQSSELCVAEDLTFDPIAKYLVYEERVGVSKIDTLSELSIEKFYDSANASSRSLLYGKDAMKFELGRDIGTYCRNAVREYYCLCKLIHINKLTNYDKTYRKLAPLMSGEKLTAEVYAETVGYVTEDAEGYGLYDLDTKQFVLPPKELKCFEKAYDGHSFVHLTYKDNSDGRMHGINRKDFEAQCSKSRYVLVGKSSELMQEEKIHKRLSNIMHKVDSFVPGDLRVVVGTPGCGKSTTIAKTVDKSASSVRGDLVITPSAENAANLREKVGDKLNMTKYRTDDSYLMNVKEDDRVWQRLIVDEAMMAPFGKLVAVMILCEAKQIVLYGDPYQLPYILRLPDTTSIYQRVPVELMPKSSLNVSMCVPQSITKFFNTTYAKVGGYRTRSRLLGEIEVIKITNEQNVTSYARNTVVYLTFKQSEKKILQEKFCGENEVFTIHEYQGKRADHIVLVRLSSRQNETLYNSNPHILVAFTRAIKKFTYYTPLLNDSVSMACYVMQSMTSETVRDIVESAKSGGCKFEDMRFDLPDYQQAINDEAMHKDSSTRELYNLHVTAQCIERPLSTGRALSARLDARNLVNADYFENVVNNGDHSHIVARFGLIDSPYFSVQPKSYHPMLDKVQSIVQVPLWKCGSPLQTLQDAYDNCMEGLSIVDDRYWLYDAAHCDLEINFDNIKLDTFKDYYKPKLYDNLTPALKTLCPRNRVCNQRELMVNYKYRNEASAELASSNVSKDLLIETTVKSFCEAYLVKDYESKFAEYAANPIAPSSAVITKWIDELKLRGKNVRADKTMSAYFDRLQEFSFAQKEKAKVFTKANKAFELPTLQTISYQGDDVNAFFCPMSKVFKERLMAIMKPNFLLYFDISPENFADKFQEHLGAAVLNRKSVEFDISKFDQSLTQTDLEILVRIMRLMGIVEEVAVIYLHTMTTSFLVNRQEGFKGTVYAQQKSGHAFTLPFNTTMTMAALASVIDMSKIDGGVFCGDDSLLFMPEDSPFRADVSSRLEEMYNFEVKLEQYDHALFCSKFLIDVQGKVTFVPDVLKLITKLGRKDLVDKQHVEDYRISLLDLTKDYADAAVVQVLGDALNSRYNVQMQWDGVISAILQIVADKDQFSSLWYLAEGDIPFRGSVRPDLEM